MALTKEYKNIIYFLIILGFSTLLYYFFFRPSLVEPFKEAIENKTSANPLVQIGENSSTINMLREKIDIINPDKIIKQLDTMKNTIKSNTENIKQVKEAQDKIDSAMKNGDK